VLDRLLKHRYGRVGQSPPFIARELVAALRRVDGRHVKQLSRIEIPDAGDY
jgi:hypothetical protein